MPGVYLELSCSLLGVFGEFARKLLEICWEITEKLRSLLVYLGLHGFHELTRNLLTFYKVYSQLTRSQLGVYYT